MHAPQALMPRQHVPEHVPRGAADVDERADPREVVCLRHGRRFAAVEPHHRLAEQRRHAGVVLTVLEQAHAVRLFEPGVAGGQAVAELLPGRLHHVADQGDDRRARGAGCSGSECGAEVREAEAVSPGEFEQAEAGQRPQVAIELAVPHAVLAGEVLGGARLVAGELVRQAHLRRLQQQLAAPVGDRHLHQPRRRGRLVHPFRHESSRRLRKE
jgi:hypothetical protein